MSVYKVFPSKDTFITNYRKNAAPRTGSNFGASEILHVFKTFNGFPSASLARILSKFDVSEIQDRIDEGVIPSTGSQYVLKFYDAQHDRTLPSSYVIEVQALSQDWDEGRGHDTDNFYDKGFANWSYAKSFSAWTQSGSVGTGSILTASFDTGHEDLELDVTPIVESWLSNTIPNNGFLVKLSSSLESDSNPNEYYVKMFHSRETFFPERKPCIEVRWDDFKTDDRNNMHLNTTGSLHLYTSNSTLLGTGSVNVNIINSGNIVQTATGTYDGDGAYSVQLAIPSGVYSGSFYDQWINPSNLSSSLSMSFDIKEDVQNSLGNDRYVVAVQDLKDEYSAEEVVRLNVFVQKKDYNPAVYLTSSHGPASMVIPQAYYKVTNDVTGATLIPFSTGTLEYTRMSYDGTGNYLTLFMNSLPVGSVYRLTFLFVVNGLKQYITGDSFKFKVL